MSDPCSGIDETTKQFIQAQSIYFVASAPVSLQGHINLSPKGLDTFRVLGTNTVAYLDLTGSGVETIAHVKENGRIVVMFCAFQGAPRILRLHGHGRVVGLQDTEFMELKQHFPNLPGIRAIIVIDVHRVADTCGFGVPILKYERDREELPAWADSKGPEAMTKYRVQKNRMSVDGLPGSDT